MMIAALFGVGVVTGGGEEEGSEPASPAAEVDVERVARKLERVRELEFKRLPPVRQVSAEEARDEGLTQLDEHYPLRQRRADEEVLSLLGLIPRGSDLREMIGTIFGEEVAGYYDDRTKRMTLVGEGGIDEITLAHELTHALEDQYFDISAEEGSLDDEASAYTALVEGTATVAMVDYVNPRADRSAVLGALDVADLLSSTGDLPPYVQHSLLFPYSAGARFVDAIGTWGPADRALRSKPPVSTEQVLHPDKYRSGEQPLPVSVKAPRGRGWRSVTSGTVGEFDTAELIRSADSVTRAERAAEGWGGGAYKLWQRGHQSALGLAWRFDTRRDAAEFLAAVPRYIERTLRGSGDVRLDRGGVVRLEIVSGR